MLGGNTPAKLTDLAIPFKNIVTLALGFAAIGFFVMLLIGGFKYITSGGDPKAAGAAKQTITFAVIGMVFIASSYLIIRIIGQFTNVNISVFNLCYSLGTGC